MKNKLMVIGGIAFVLWLGVSLYLAYDIGESYPIDAERRIHILKNPHSVSGRAISSYAPVYQGLATTGGWATLNVSLDYLDLLHKPNEAVDEKNCTKLEQAIIDLNALHIVSFNKHCDFLEECGFMFIQQEGDVCWYLVVRDDEGL